MKAYFIHCSTGCTCCSYENHIRGPVSSLEAAKKAVKTYHEISLLSSQYARTGVYEISEHEAEQLPDGRIIAQNFVFDGFNDEYPDEISTTLHFRAVKD